MFVDDVRERGFRLFDLHNTKDAVCFRINEKVQTFVDGSDIVKALSRCPETAQDRVQEFMKFKTLPHPLPYSNMLLQFDGDLAVWWSTYIPDAGSQMYITAIGLSKPSLVEPKGAEINNMLIFTFDKESMVLDEMTFVADGHRVEADQLSADDRKHSSTMMFILFRFATFLSCKNIRTVDNFPDTKLQKKRQKRGKLPLVTYKTLELDIGSTGHSGSNKSTGEWTNRVHLCRGHMSEYGINGKGKLFGKHTGRYWIPPHARGNRKQGMVVKDYLIKE